MIDLRRVRIGIEISGQFQFYENLRIRAKGVKHANPLQNECTVSINGLNAETRNYLLTETSPFNENRTAKRITVEAGRESKGLFVVYIGDIVSAEIGTSPDLELIIRAKTNNANAGKITVFSAEPLSRLSVIAEQVAESNGVRLEFQATDKNIANYTFSGPTSRQVARLAEAGRVRAYIDDRTLYVRDRDLPVTDRRRILNVNSGMVGIPQPTDDGAKVTYLIDGESDLGGQLTIDSLLNPAVNGDYVINQLEFEVTNYDDPFFYTAICTRMNV